jgi:cell division protein FtsQ
LPKLKVIGSPEYYRSYWTPLYQVVSRTPVKVMEIDCQEPANLILKTELGIVHLGPYTPQLAEQLKVLAKMRQLSKKMNSSQIAYIDLKNPATPLVQMNQTPIPKLVKQDTP